MNLLEIAEYYLTYILIIQNKIIFFDILFLYFEIIYNVQYKKHINYLININLKNTKDAIYEFFSFFSSR